MRTKRRNLTWLAITGVLVALAILSGITEPLVAAALLVLYLGAVAASLIDLQPRRLVTTGRSSLTRMRMSPQAQEAVARAARRGSTLNTDLTLLDIGLIATQTSREGMSMRRTRSLTKDDDGVRPFITLHVSPIMADVNTVVRFEMIDSQGNTQYVHEMKVYLRDGEMNILADHHLPLTGNARLTALGDGDLRVYIDNALVAVQSYALAPSVRERGRQFAAARASERLAERESGYDDEDVPVSLEDLMRRQRSTQDGGR